jgi:hypothetical protein
MSGGYSPKVSNPQMSNNIVQMRSEELQRPFFFGGAQTPVALGLSGSQYSGSSGTGLGMGLSGMKVSRKLEDQVLHKDGAIMNKHQRLPFMK